MTTNHSPEADHARPISAEQAGELAFDLIRMLKLLHALRDRAPRVVPGLDPAAQPLLHRVAHCAGARVSDLAAALHADVSTISRYASNLANAGLLEKVTDPADRRVQALELTDAGRAALASLHEQRAIGFARVLRDWTPDDIGRFRALLNRFADDLARDLDDQAAPASHTTEDR